MPADPMLTGELKSLHDAVLASQRERQSQPPSRPAAGDAAPPAGERVPPDRLREVVDEVTAFLGEAEKNVAAHPVAAVVGAFALGLVLGRLLGRRP